MHQVFVVVSNMSVLRVQLYLKFYCIVSCFLNIEVNVDKFSERCCHSQLLILFQIELS